MKKYYKISNPSFANGRTCSNSGIWTFGETKQAIWRRHLEPWEVVIGISSTIFFTFHRPNYQSIMKIMLKCKSPKTIVNTSDCRVLYTRPSNNRGTDCSPPLPGWPGALAKAGSGQAAAESPGWRTHCHSPLHCYHACWSHAPGYSRSSKGGERNERSH